MEKNLVDVVKNMAELNVHEVDEKNVIITFKNFPGVGLLVKKESSSGHRWVVTFKGADKTPFILTCVGRCCVDQYGDRKEFVEKINKIVLEQGVKVLYARNAQNISMGYGLKINICEGDGLQGVLIVADIPITLYDSYEEIAPEFSL